MATSKIKNVFILMLENHSFDNVFGFSGIKGLRGLRGNETNRYKGVTYPVKKGAPVNMASDPGHEFGDTLEQLCGMNAQFIVGAPYPAIDNSGFVYNFATSTTEGTASKPDHVGDVMMCFDTPTQLPVLYQLATEFMVCDNWFSSMPGPTWPNRFFAYAADSGGFDDSPSNTDIGKWNIAGNGMSFENGSILDLLKKNNSNYRLYQDRYKQLVTFPIVLALKDVHEWEINDLATFKSDLSNGYNYPLTIIEPNYGNFMNGTYKGGSSQHPMDGMAKGEELIKNVYEAIRNSPVWEQSLLIITYDEHGGFYDSVAPPKATPPYKNYKGTKFSRTGFKFDRYGVRVPAVVVSPFIPKQTVSHDLLDHTSMLKTVEEMLGLPPLTERDKAANSLLPLLTSKTARTDCPKILNAVNFAVDAPSETTPIEAEKDDALYEKPLPERGNIHGFLAIAQKIDRELSQGTPLFSSGGEIKTLGQARDYMNSVLKKVQNTPRK
jgi:phospholipase C